MFAVRIIPLHLIRSEGKGKYTGIQYRDQYVFYFKAKNKKTAISLFRKKFKKTFKKFALINRNEKKWIISQVYLSKKTEEGYEQIPGKSLPAFCYSGISPTSYYGEPDRFIPFKNGFSSFHP